MSPGNMVYCKWRYLWNKKSSSWQRNKWYFLKVICKINSSNKLGTAFTAEDNKDGDLYSQAIAIVKRDKKTSISYIQRQLRIGYNRAATLIEKMQEDGILSEPNHTGKREIIEE